jgi:hypothetical protein
LFIFFNILALLVLATIVFACINAKELGIFTCILVVLMFVGFVGWSFGTTTKHFDCNGARTTLKSRNFP